MHKRANLIKLAFLRGSFLNAINADRNRVSNHQALKTKWTELTIKYKAALLKSGGDAYAIGLKAIKKIGNKKIDFERDITITEN